MIDSIKDLEKLLKLCRKQGVTDIELGTVKIKLGDLPEKMSYVDDPALQDKIDDPYANFPSGILSAEQLAFYSAGGAPEDDPMLGVEQ